MSQQPGDMFEDLFGPNGRGPFNRPPTRKKPEKGIPWEAKIIDGAYYVPLAQVAELLKSNDVLPAVTKGIDARVEMQKLKHEEGL